MDPDALVPVATYVSNIEAELARSALEAAAIDALVQADDCGGTRPHLWMGGIRLMVRAEDADRAREVLNAETRLMEPAGDTGEG
jgi:hypothetical protein